MRRRNQRQRPDDPITATEVASWAYCPEAWRLEYGLGLEAGNRESRAGSQRRRGI